MIGNSLPELIFIRASILGLRSIAPLSFIYLAASTHAGAFLWTPVLGAWAITEAAFYTLVYLPRRRSMQKNAVHPPLTAEERRTLFDKCSKCMSEASATGWFTYANGDRVVKRGNAMDWLLWGLFASTQLEMIQDWEAEMEHYVSVMATHIGYELDPGSNPDMQCFRLTLDPVRMVHRPFVWYLIVGLVDGLTSCAMFYHGFKHYDTRKWFQVFPLRPLLALASRRSADPDIPYWYREHRSKDKLPILFIHGIGSRQPQLTDSRQIGLWPYTKFFRELIEQDPDVGILAVEILPVSMRLAAPPLPRDAMCAAVARILDAHDLPRVVVAGHSYGTVVAAHLHHNPAFAARIAGMLLVDPIPFLLHHPDIAYNFVYRVPRAANEWQLWFFASSDPDIARALARHFFWFENILFKEELAGRRVAVSLAEKDQIVNAQEVRRYLTGQDEPSARWAEGDMEVLYHAGLDHATVFDTPERRRTLLEILGRFVREA
ncbi:hypothetical protein FA95DRAFT_1577541 [Auriscalpium vulgare]|uniref:Uncharacterized protein n=1 Tax=Auriscalpium vulgare TaxID=40419 RepID=A0ACB8R654_9AGAM|nr:hypothetical protein FA95DRAFT_1577541 [Auriscalpium vulgare]